MTNLSFKARQAKVSASLGVHIFYIAFQLFVAASAIYGVFESLTVVGWYRLPLTIFSALVAFFVICGMIVSLNLLIREKLSKREVLRRE